MQKYRVKWEVEIEAENPIEAAKQGLEIQQDMNNEASVFDVSYATSGLHIQCVDLYKDRLKLGWLKIACEYLVPNELNIEEQVLAIAKNENPNQLIDYVDGVCVWEKIEDEFTCIEFLDSIGYHEDLYDK